MRALRVGLGMMGVAGLSFVMTAACGSSGGGGGGAGATDGGAATGGGGTTGTGATGTGATGTGATGGTTSVQCKTAADCASKLPATTPPDCAEAECDTVLGKCAFKAKDADGDGHTAENCVASSGGVIEAGDDCDDTDPAIFPGAGTEKCDGKDDNCDGKIDEDSPNSTDPCTVGVGLCAATGVKTCKGGSYTGCSATPGTPVPDAQFCDDKDHDCDGAPNTGCGCTTGKSQPCGNCNGTQTCVAGAWGPCSVPTPPNLGASCNNSCGTIQCSGACSNTTANVGGACNNSCGTIQCSGACSNTTTNVGGACNSNCGTIQCNGTCNNTTANVGGNCNGNCGKIQCSGACSNTTANVGGYCNSNCGTIQCSGACSSTTPNVGQTCSQGCGTRMCSGKCSNTYGSPVQMGSPYYGNFACCWIDQYKWFGKTCDAGFVFDHCVLTPDSGGGIISISGTGGVGTTDCSCQVHEQNAGTEGKAYHVTIYQKAICSSL